MSEETKVLTMEDLEREEQEQQNTVEAEETSANITGEAVFISSSTEGSVEVADISDLKPTKEEEFNPDLTSQAVLDGMEKFDAMIDQATAILENANQQKKIAEHFGDIAPAKTAESKMAEYDKIVEAAKEKEVTADNVSSLYESLSEEFMDETGNEKKKEEIMKNKEIIKSKLKEALKPVTEKLDLSTFTIQNETNAVFDIFKAKPKTYHVADWYLPTTDVLLSMREFSGMELEKLNPANSTRSEMNTYTDIYRLIYEHITNENKPTFEEFIKLVKYDDDDHLYAAIFKSSFNKNNVFPYQCEKEGCKHVFVEHIDEDENFRFVSEEKKNAFYEKLNSASSVFTAKRFNSEVIQIDDDYAVSIFQPSIFNVIFETMSLKKEFREKHASMIGMIMYISNIFKINKESRELVPIKLETYEDDVAKTVRYKIFAYSQVLDAISSDSLQALTAIIANISSDDPFETCVIPERKCPLCGSVIKEKPISPKELLFTRHQLGALANS